MPARAVLQRSRTSREWRSALPGTGTSTAFSHWMKFTTLAALLLSSATALAAPHDELAVARQHVQAASTRVSYHELEATIAERDIATAKIIQATASKARTKALAAGDNVAASAWARRHADAVKDEREAQDRAAQKRAERDRAREELQASTDRVKSLELGPRASR